MLLLKRKTNESITAWPKGQKHDPLVIRVTEVAPNGEVVIGFDGLSYDICRTEVFHTFNTEPRHGESNGPITNSTN